MRRLVEWLNLKWNSRVTSDREYGLVQQNASLSEQVADLKEQLEKAHSTIAVQKVELDLLMAVQARNLERVKAETAILGKAFETLEPNDDA